MHLDAPARVFNHALDHEQANAGAFNVVVEALEHAEQLGQLVRGQPEAVVVHFQHRVAGAPVPAHVHVGAAVGVAVLEGIAHQVVDHGAQVFFGKMNGQQAVEVYPELGVGFAQQRG